MKKIITKLLLGAMLLPLTVLAGFSRVPVNVEVVNDSNTNPNPVTVQFQLTQDSDLNVDNWDGSNSPSLTASPAQAPLPPEPSIYSLNLWNYEGAKISGHVDVHLQATIGSYSMQDDEKIHFTNNKIDVIDPSTNCHGTDVVCCFGTKDVGKTTEILAYCGTGI